MLHMTKMPRNLFTRPSNMSSADFSISFPTNLTAMIPAIMTRIKDKNENHLLSLLECVLIYPSTVPEKWNARASATK